MKNVRLYGNSPYNIAVLHGGPGAAGEMAPVAKSLAAKFGVLEPLQTEKSVYGQIQELHSQINEFGELPITLIGYSWGAWLAYMFASLYPDIVKKLILVSAPAFEEKYSADIFNERLKRLSAAEQEETLKLRELIKDPENINLNNDFERFGELISKADSFDELPDRETVITFNPEVHQLVWSQAHTLRINGKIIEFAALIKCPVVAIHGTHDPHLVDGVKLPLSAALTNFRLVLLEKCGHTPWREKYVRDKFFEVLESEL
ncbi:MAG TPA: alpha/beta hydrolase [Ignavibacteria bacterium]|jgi:pimeloyl-ACP methyl ester carboxylesterase